MRECVRGAHRVYCTGHSSQKQAGEGAEKVVMESHWRRLCWSGLLQCGAAEGPSTSRARRGFLAQIGQLCSPCLLAAKHTVASFVPAMSRLLVALLVSASLSSCYGQSWEEAPYINHVTHNDLIDLQRKSALHDTLMNGLRATAQSGGFKEMKVDNKHKEHVKEMLRGEIKPVRTLPSHLSLPRGAVPALPRRVVSVGASFPPTLP